MVWQGPSCFSHSSVPLGALPRVVHSNRKVESREIQQLCLVTKPVMSFERQRVHSVGWRSNQYFATSDCQYPNWCPHSTWPRWFRGLWGKPHLFCTLCLFQRCVCHGANVRHWGPWLLWGPRSNFCGHPAGHSSGWAPPRPWVPSRQPQIKEAAPIWIANDLKYWTWISNLIHIPAHNLKNTAGFGEPLKIKAVAGSLQNPRYANNPEIPPSLFFQHKNLRLGTMASTPTNVLFWISRELTLGFAVFTDNDDYYLNFIAIVIHQNDDHHDKIQR